MKEIVVGAVLTPLTGGILVLMLWAGVTGRLAIPGLLGWLELIWYTLLTICGLIYGLVQLFGENRIGLVGTSPTQSAFGS